MGMHGKQLEIGSGTLAEIKPVGTDHVANRVPSTRLTPLQTTRGILADTDMPTDYPCGPLPGHRAHLRRMTGSSRLCSGGGMEPGVRDSKVARARYDIRTGKLETPCVVSQAIDKMTAAMIEGKIRLCSQCNQPLFDRGNGDPRCLSGCSTSCRTA